MLPFFFSSETEPLNDLNISAIQLDSIEQVLIKRERVRKGDTSNYSHYNSSERYRSKKSIPASAAPKIDIIDINNSDSADFEKLPGIGEKLSARIVKYRERIGGFIMIDQLKDIYGMQDSNFMKFKPFVKVDHLFIPHKIMINKATYAELRRHPYINHLFAKSILAYIKMHGSISGQDELMSIGSINKSEAVKAMPYLDFQQ